jgi:hypothetical protein
MGCARDGRWRAIARLQRSNSGRKEDNVDGSRTGQCGRTKVQHQRFTGRYYRQVDNETLTIMVLKFSVYYLFIFSGNPINIVRTFKKLRIMLVFD